MFLSRRSVKIATATAIGLGTLSSLRANEYDLGSIGIVRLTRAASAVYLIGRNYKKSLYNTGLDKKSDEYLAKKSAAHSFGAEKLLQLCCANKGVYIKVGQHIGALDYLLPKEYVATMRVLHSSAPESSFNDILTVLREDLKRDPSAIFDSIEERPLGTASLAQVHEARLKDGRKVAVKVQHRSVRTNSYVDLKTMEALVRITSWCFPEFKFDWLVEETRKNIPKELDFKLEAENADKVRSLFSDCSWLHVPHVHWDLTSNRVLTMEYVEGGHVNDSRYYQKHKIDPYEVSDKLGKLYSRMIFITGFVHSDPHPGNIMVRKPSGKETQVVLLDHGLYAELSDEFRWEYSKLWLAILNRDKVSMKRHCTNLGVKELYGLLACMVSGRSWETIMRGVQNTRYDSKEKELFQKEMPDLLPKITEVLEKVDRHMLLVLKTNDLIRSIEYNLNTHARMTAFREMSTCCVKAIYGERLRHSESRWSRWTLVVQERWTLFKIVVYYAYLSLVNFNVKRSLIFF